MNKPEIFVEILPTGRIKAEIRGVKGKGCMEYARLLEEVVGTLQSVEHTSEYYEPEQQVTLLGHTDLHLDQMR